MSEKVNLILKYRIDQNDIAKNHFLINPINIFNDL